MAAFEISFPAKIDFKGEIVKIPVTGMQLSCVREIDVEWLRDNYMCKPIFHQQRQTEAGKEAYRTSEIWGVDVWLPKTRMLNTDWNVVSHVVTYSN